MITFKIGLIALSALVLSSGVALAASAPPPGSETTPEVVAISEASPGKWIYRRFPSLMPLYIFDDDPPGKSVCNRGCKSVWPPLWATDDDKPIGNWTVVTREDDNKQWAYKGKPVYVRFHDSPELRLGDGEEGKWHLVEP